MRYYSGGHLHGTTNCGDKGNSGTVTTARRMAEAMADPDAPVQLISATSDQLFLDYMDRRDELPTYDGELLMDVHAGGCYTSQGAMKYYNRRNEELLGAAERAAVAADWLGAKPYDRAKLNEVWQRVLWHQFHDDLTGTSIADAYRYSWNDELISLQQATEVMTAAVGALSHSLDTRVKGTSVVVYNPVTYDLRDLVEAEVPLDARAKGGAVYAPSGRRVAAQILSREGDRARILFAADVKAAGYAVYDVRPASGVAKSSALKASERTLENRIYRVELDANGDIRSIRDKRAGRELVAEGKAFRMAVFEGNPSNRYPAWEIMKGDDGQARASDRRRRAHFDCRTGARARHAQSGAQLRPLEVRAVRVADRRRRRRPHQRAQHGRLVEPRRAAESRIPLCRGQREGGLRPRAGLHRARQQHRNGL